MIWYEFVGAPIVTKSNLSEAIRNTNIYFTLEWKNMPKKAIKQ